MTLEDIVKNIAIKGKSIEQLYSDYISLSQTRDEAAQKNAKDNVKEIKARLSVFDLPADANILQNLFNGDEESRNTALAILHEREKEIIQEHDLEKYANAAYALLTKDYPEAKEKDLKQKYAWNNLDGKLKDYVKDVIAGDSILNEIKKLMTYSNPKSIAALMEKGVEEDYIKNAKKSAKKVLKEKIDAYLIGWGDNSKNFVLKLVEQGNSFIMKYLAAVEQEITIYAKESIPGRDKKYIGNKHIETMIENAGYASA